VLVSLFPRAGLRRIPQLLTAMVLIVLTMMQVFSDFSTKGRGLSAVGGTGCGE
jgi:hypothetical protein